jgi:hypothetical protein
MPASSSATGAIEDVRLSSGGRIFETILSRAHVTFDGGQAWTTYPLAPNAYMATDDPAVAFDADGRAYPATLGFLFSQGLGCCTDPDVLVSTSADGGRTWLGPTRIASGAGTFGGPGILNDNEYLTAWGHGNAMVTISCASRPHRYRPRSVAAPGGTCCTLLV